MLGPERGQLALAHMTGEAAPSLGDGKEAPGVWDPLEFMLPAVIELDPGAGDEVLHGARNEHLAGSRKRRDASADRDRDAFDLAVCDLTLAGMEAGTNVEVESLKRVAD